MNNPTEHTLIEQMRITEFEVENRKALLSLTNDDVSALLSCRAVIEKNLDTIINSHYAKQIQIPEIALIIGDANTLEHLKIAQRRYILDLFSGVYDLDYVENRCRVGLIHKRIGVDPKLYLAGVLCLKESIGACIEKNILDKAQSVKIWEAMDRLLIFDVSLVFDTYIRTLVTEIETEKNKTEVYATSLEEKIRIRTRQLEDLAQIDPLTGLLNTRHLHETLTKILRNAESCRQPVSIVYIDVNDFKLINDTEGHQRGDEILQMVGKAIKGSARPEDFCFRYGGDEFCVILGNCTEQQAREIYVMSLQKRMLSVNISLSIGVAQTGTDIFIDGTQLIKNADEDMYISKAKHKAAKLKNFPK